MKSPFPPDVIEAFRQHAVEAFPQECVGVITASGYERLVNRHPDPTRFFDAGEEVDVRIAGGEILALCHSHNLDTGLDHPSVEDQRGQIASGIPWGLCIVQHGLADEPFFWGAGIADGVPLMPRDWRWGPTGTDGRGDCFSLIQDWYREHQGLRLPDQARDGNWERENPGQYEQGWRDLHFTPIVERDLQVGDLILVSVRFGGRANHGMIYLGGDTVLHQAQNRLTVRESYGFWRRAQVVLLRPPSVEKAIELGWQKA